MDSVQLHQGSRVAGRMNPSAAGAGAHAAGGASAAPGFQPMPAAQDIAMLDLADAAEQGTAAGGTAAYHAGNSAMPAAAAAAAAAAGRRKPRCNAADAPAAAPAAAPPGFAEKLGVSGGMQHRCLLAAATAVRLWVGTRLHRQGASSRCGCRCCRGCSSSSSACCCPGAAAADTVVTPPPAAPAAALWGSARR